MSKNKRQKIAIFEYIKLESIPILSWYLLRSYKIKYFKAAHSIEKRNWFQKKLKKNQLEKITWDNYDFEWQHRINEVVFEQIEKIYEKILKESKIIREAEKLIKSNLINGVYKKSLAENLKYTFDILFTLNDLVEKNDFEKIVFFPIHLFEINSKIDNKLDSRIKISPLSYLVIFFTNTINKIKTFSTFMALPIWKLIHIKKIFPNQKNPEYYQAGIRIYKNDWGLNKKFRTIDFLLNNKELNKDNTIFCIETDISNEYLQKLKEKKYNIVKIPEILSEVDKIFMKETLNFQYIFICFKVAILSFFEVSFYSKPNLTVFHNYLIWKRVSDRYRIKHYVAYNDFSIEHIIRNIFLNQCGTKTWYYEHSSHFSNNFTKENGKVPMRDIEFSFLYYDYLVSWNEKTTSTYRMYPSFVKKYLTLGSLWSEHVRMLCEGEKKSNILENIKIKMEKMPTNIIGIFDTTFRVSEPGLSMPLQGNDMKLFIEGIIEILDDNPDVGVIFKEKWDWNEFLEWNPEKDIKSIYEKLKKHPRCFVTGNEFETAEAIAYSDLVVSACFTSTTIEALGAGKKAIFFDGAENLRDYYYDKFPKMVAHGYSELKDFVNYWLYKVKEGEFKDYLEEHVKSEIDPYVDGMAITRFRELLIK
jgi:polysaccharide biosynthesis PFTS motif protein